MPRQQAGSRLLNVHVCVCACVRENTEYLISQESNGSHAVSQCLILNEGATGSLLILTTRIIYAQMDPSAAFKHVFCCRADSDTNNKQAQPSLSLCDLYAEKLFSCSFTPTETKSNSNSNHVLQRNTHTHTHIYPCFQKIALGS